MSRETHRLQDDAEYGSTWQGKESPVLLLVEGHTDVRVMAVDDRGCGPRPEVDIDTEYLNPSDQFGETYETTSVTLDKAQAEAFRDFLLELFPLGGP